MAVIFHSYLDKDLYINAPYNEMIRYLEEDFI